MRTYRDIFGVPEFTPLFAAATVQLAALTIGQIALATLVFGATGSSLLAALSMFGSSFAQVVGALTLLSVADRVPPRAAMTGLALIFAGGTLLLALPGLPVAVIMAVIAVLGLAGSVGGGVRWGLLNEILPADGYVLGRSVFNMAVGLMQIGGYALGGVLLAVASPGRVLLVSAALYLAAALAARFGLTPRPARASGRASIGETWRVNARLWSDPVRRNAFFALWVPNGLVVGCEALFVPYAPGSASVLFTAGALGMLLGDMTMGRFVPPGSRGRLITPLRMLLAAPYLAFALLPPLPVAVLAVALASFGFGAGLLLQERLIAATPPEMHGQALGLNSAGMLTMQAIGATVAGALADHLPVAATITAMAVVSLAVTLALTPGLRTPVQILATGSWDDTVGWRGPGPESRRARSRRATSWPAREASPPGGP
ncbi:MULTISPECIES: MFS transporter [Thermomonosporaceae]|uniref:MFS transporter n=1 Tax=Thermomonosporaceae TaxID=2012 RepID=UPI00255AE19D|nr:MULTISPECIES: MFS transporter [Thermomonosporaceae]MDL4775628.1 MFS transporter [Actinomadura xylanilytica]